MSKASWLAAIFILTATHHLLIPASAATTCTHCAAQPRKMCLGISRRTRRHNGDFVGATLQVLLTSWKTER